MWFEKFHWFLTSDGVLVMGGRDAHQNETLFKKFLRKGDAYMHADVHGAPTCIVRNPFPKTGTARAIPAESMRQAGTFCVCKSSAWSSKIVTSAWWVESHQVSRTAPTGEYLPTGSFMIRGKKNYLQANRLEMSFGYIFKIDTTAKDTVDENQDEVEGNDQSIMGDSRDREWRYMRGKVQPPAELLVPLDGGEDGATSNVFTVIEANTTAQSKKKMVQAKAANTAPGTVQVPKRGGSRNPNKASASAAPEVPVHVAQEKAKEAALQEKRGPSKKKLLKMKRANKKYGDQTEEERKLAMRALGHHIEDDSDDENEEASHQASDEGGLTWLQQNSTKQQSSVGQQVKDDGDSKDVHDEQDAKEDDSKDEPVEDDTKDIPDAGDSKDVEEEEEEEEAEPQVEQENVLFEGFTAVPQPGDVILFALAFCGPVDSLAHFKYRVKLTPGTLKKGKAAKQAVQLFQTKGTERERTVINQVTDPENVAAMMYEFALLARQGARLTP